MALYNYEEDEPTWYDFVWEDSTEAETLESTPDFTWQGCEMYFAIVDALDDIGADSSDVQVAWHTPNFVLDGYSISAGTAEDGTLKSMHPTRKTPTPPASMTKASGNFPMKALQI